MDKLRFIIFVLVVFLTLNAAPVNAGKVPGYIILNNNETLYGEIKVSNFDRDQNSILIQSNVWFKDKRDKHFKSYAPKDILELGFFYKSINYKFKSFVIDYNSLVPSESQKIKFLGLIFQGELSVYRDLVQSVNHKKSTSQHKDIIIDTYDYYLYNDRQGLKRVVLSKEFPSVIDLLNQRFI